MTNVSCFDETGDNALPLTEVNRYRPHWANDQAGQEPFFHQAW